MATDAAEVALSTLSEPDRWPRLYSRAGFERWDIEKSASYATQGNRDHFERMPDLEDESVREALRQRVAFVHSDWADLPLAAGSVDAIFATNALPRESRAEQLKVLGEGVRVVRLGGLVLIAQHNFFGSDVEHILSGTGWVAANLLGQEHPVKLGAITFQIIYSSG